MVLGELLLTGDIIINTLRKCAVCTTNNLETIKKEHTIFGQTHLYQEQSGHVVNVNVRLGLELTLAKEWHLKL